MKIRFLLISTLMLVSLFNNAQFINLNNIPNPENLSAQQNYDYGKEFLEQGKRNLQSNYWYDGYYFYKALELFSNSYLMEYKQSEILAYLLEINSIGQSRNDFYKSFSEATLNKISSAYQKENKLKIDSLNRVVSQLEKDDNKKTILLEKYIELLKLQEYYFSNGKFQGYYYKDTKVKKAKFEIEIGNINLGCLELYEADILYFHNYGFASNVCKVWYDNYSDLQNEKYKKEEKNKASLWYKKNQNKVKLRSLLGENYITIESYFDSPIKRDYKIDVGAGIRGQQFIGNKYKSNDGIYEIGFRNGIAIFIQFYPTTQINFSKDKFGSDETGFDMESVYRGICTFEKIEGNIGNLDMYSINYDCAESGLSATVFYGLNGKLLSVIAY